MIAKLSSQSGIVEEDKSDGGWQETGEQREKEKIVYIIYKYIRKFHQNVEVYSMFSSAVVRWQKFYLFTVGREY